MSTANTVYSQSNFQITNYDTTKIFIKNNEWEQGTFVNSTYDDIVLPAGTVLGRVAASNEIVVLNAAASDGSQFPVGILANNQTIIAGESKTLTYCIAGHVVEDLISLPSGVTLNTVVSSRTVRDRIKADTAGIVLVERTELTDFDNQ
jgi:hypothetical protein